MNWLSKQASGRMPAVCALSVLSVLGVLVADAGAASPQAAAGWVLSAEPAASPLAPRSVWLSLEPPGGRWPERATYRWRCGERLPVVETARATRGCRYDEPGRYQPSVVIAAPGRPDVLVTLSESVVVSPRPPLTVDLTVAPSNRWWRAPLDVTATVKVRGGLDDEPVTAVTWLLDDEPLPAASDVNRQASRLHVDAPGPHRLLAVVRTSWRTVTATRVLDVRANTPPACTISQEALEPPAPPATVRLSAQCVDRDGSAISYRWTIGGETRSGAAVEWTAPKAGKYPVRLLARDEAGAETQVDTVVEWAS